MEDGIHTYDIFKEGVSKEKVGTKEFAEAVIARLGQKPSLLKAVKYDADAKTIPFVYKRRPAAEKKMVGIDVFVHWRGSNPDELAAIAQQANDECLELSMISNRGIKVWPNGFDETFCTDHWRMRYTCNPEKGHLQFNNRMIARFLDKVTDTGLEFVKTEHLFEFDGKPGFSLGQGQ